MSDGLPFFRFAVYNSQSKRNEENLNSTYKSSLCRGACLVAFWIVLRVDVVFRVGRLDSLNFALCKPTCRCCES